MLGGIGGRRRRDDRGWDGWMASPTRWTLVWVNSGSWWWTGGLACCDSWGHKESDTTERLNWTESNTVKFLIVKFTYIHTQTYTHTLLYHVLSYFHAFALTIPCAHTLLCAKLILTHPLHLNSSIISSINLHIKSFFPNTLKCHGIMTLHTESMCVLN